MSHVTEQPECLPIVCLAYSATEPASALIFLIVAKAKAPLQSAQRGRHYHHLTFLHEAKT